MELGALPYWILPSVEVPLPTTTANVLAELPCFDVML
jgi:hypothetical protein